MQDKMKIINLQWKNRVLVISYGLQDVKCHDDKIFFFWPVIINGTVLYLFKCVRECS